MAKQFLGKVAIITGSSSGIGRETAVLFAEQGAKLTITGRNSQALENVKTKLVAAGLQSGDVLIVQGNLIEESVQKRLVEETVSKFGQIDILVNNAGSLAPDNTKTLGFNQSMDEWDFTMDLNLKSVAQLSRLVMPHLIKTKGSIVNVSSIGSTNYNAAFPYYCVAKAGVDHLTRCLAMAFIDKGVRVNAVNPGLVHTGLMNKQGFTDEQAEKYCETAKDRTKIPAGRAAHPREIGELIAFLADSKKSDYIIGQCIVIDGGRSMARTPL